MNVKLEYNENKGILHLNYKLNEDDSFGYRTVVPSIDRDLCIDFTESLHKDNPGRIWAFTIEDVKNPLSLEEVKKSYKQWSTLLSKSKE